MMEVDNRKIERECIEKDFCNIQKVNKNEFENTYKLLIETFKDGIEDRSGGGDSDNDIVPKTIK